LEGGLELVFGALRECVSESLHPLAGYEVAHQPNVSNTPLPA
jgi:hypothetical protein